MKFFKPLFLLLSAFSLLSCSKEVIDTTGTLFGTVIDARTNEPLSGVEITVTPLNTTVATGANGRYEIRDIEAQSYTVQAKKANYQTTQKPVTISVGESKQLDFQLTPSTPHLVVSQEAIDFGNEATTLSIELSNDGFAILNWSISEDIAWLSCSPTSGRIQAGEKTTVVFNVDRAGLDRGNYSQTIAISSNGGNSNIRVNMTVQGATISVTPDQLDFGAIKSVLPLTIKNTGSGTLPYTLSTSNTWIKLEKKSGALQSSASEQIQVSVDRAGMSEGDYGGNITLTATGIPLNIPVKMNIPSKTKPTVYLSGVTDITITEAVFNAAITSVGSTKVTRYGFCWGTQDSPTVENAQICKFGDSASPKEFNYSVGNLKQSTTYYVRAYAENAEGISYSEQEKFVTLGMPSIPTVETGEVSNVSFSQAEVSGILKSLGNVESVTQYGHVWSTKENPTINDNYTSLGQTWSAGSFISTLTGLQPHVTYHVRAYATNEKGTAYGEDVTFVTDYAAVALITKEATDITSKSAKLGGQITDKGGHTIVERGVCWGTHATPSLADKHTSASTSSDTFTVTLTELTAETAYYARAYVKTATDAVYYGAPISFTTPSKEVDITIEDPDDEEFWEK